MWIASHYYWLVLVLQAVCIVHALKRRADQRWFYVIIFLPAIGASIYLLVEVLPGLRRHRLPRLDLPLFRTLAIGALEREFRFADTVDNRVALAEAYLNHGRKQEALALYRPVINGALRNNPHLLYGYARACYINESYDEALTILTAASQVPSNAKLRERCLVMAMCHEKLGHDQPAEALFRTAMVGFGSDEARCRFALFLWNRQRRDEALEIFRKIIEHAAISDYRYHRQEAAWIALAKERIKSAAREPAEAASAKAG